MGFPACVAILIPKHVRDRIKFFMKDGDAQQRNELLASLLQFLPNAKEGGCGYHIGLSYESMLCIFWNNLCADVGYFPVNQGMKAHVPGSRTVTTRNRARWKSAVYKIKQWVYS